MCKKNIFLRSNCERYFFWSVSVDELNENEKKSTQRERKWIKGTSKERNKRENVNLLEIICFLRVASLANNFHSQI